MTNKKSTAKVGKTIVHVLSIDESIFLMTGRSTVQFLTLVSYALSQSEQYGWAQNPLTESSKQLQGDPLCRSPGLRQQPCPLQVVKGSQSKRSLLYRFVHDSLLPTIEYVRPSHVVQLKSKLSPFAEQAMSATQCVVQGDVLLHAVGHNAV